MRSANTDPTYQPAHQLAAEIAARRLSPVDIVEAFLARIAALDGKLHAYIDVYGDDARLAAEAADKAIRSGHSVGPLHGVPIALKDLIDLEGRVTTGGSMAWRDRRSPTTATLARRFFAAGMIVLGKTHTVEFAMGGWGTNQHLGTPWNPWDLEVPRTPGGSSAGSGVAVAAGLAPWAIGTDTGGSVRLPASWCGLSGLKPTIGRVSTFGILPLAPSLDTPGPMARSVEDAALLYSVMQGADPLDPRTLSAPAPSDPMPGLRRGVRGLRLARMPNAERDGCTPETLPAYPSRVGRSDDDPRLFHALRQPVGIMRAVGARRVHPDRPALVVADHLPTLRRSDRAADRLGLSTGNRLARAASAGSHLTECPRDIVSPLRSSMTEVFVIVLSHRR